MPALWPPPQLLLPALQRCGLGWHSAGSCINCVGRQQHWGIWAGQQPPRQAAAPLLGLQPALSLACWPAQWGAPANNCSLAALPQCQVQNTWLNAPLLPACILLQAPLPHVEAAVRCQLRMRRPVPAVSTGTGVYGSAMTAAVGHGCCSRCHGCGSRQRH